MKCKCDEEYCPFYDESIYDDDCCMVGIYPDKSFEYRYPVFSCSLSEEDIRKAIDKIIDIKKNLRNKANENRT